MTHLEKKNSLLVDNPKMSHESNATYVAQVHCRPMQKESVFFLSKRSLTKASLFSVPGALVAFFKRREPV